MRAKCAAGLCLAVTASVVLAACGGGKPSASPEAELRRAAARPPESTVEHVVATLRQPERLDLDLQVTSSADRGDRSARGTVAFDLGDGRPYVTRTVAGTSYLQTAAHRWSRLPSAGLPTLEPGVALMVLAGADSVRRVGPEAVAGAPATRYAGTISIDQLLKAAPQLGLDPASVGPGQASIDVWIAAEHRVRRLRAVISGPNPAAPAAVIDTTVLRTGVPVRVAAPPSTEVTAG